VFNLKIRRCYVFNPKIINPWEKGFQPPSKCPQCRRVNSLVYMGKRSQSGDHIYKCSHCGSLVNAPTHYAQCTLMDNPLEKDVFYTPCVKCPYRKTDTHHGVCIHWRKADYTDLSIADLIEETMRRYKPRDAS